MTAAQSARNFADVTAYVANGPSDDAQRWLGHESVRTAPYPINAAQIAYFCSAIEDGNETYWNREAASARHGAPISPPGMLIMWSFPLAWTPEGKPQNAPFPGVQVPLPGSTLINVSTDTTYHDIMRVGDLLTFREKVTDISREKHTGLGTGHFVTTLATVTDQDARTVATHENVIYRYEPHRRQPPTDPTPCVPPPPGDLPVVSMPITTTRCILGVAATRDFFPGHHDTVFARTQGAPNMYLNTIFYHGFFDRVVTDWTGPGGVIVRRKLAMRAPACVGSTLTTSGTTGDERIINDHRLVDVDIAAHTESGIVATASITARLDRDASS